jgi:hypothetical protein
MRRLFRLGRTQRAAADISTSSPSVVLAVTVTLFAVGAAVGLLVGRLGLEEPDDVRVEAGDAEPAAAAEAMSAEPARWPQRPDAPAASAFERPA